MISRQLTTNKTFKRRSSFCSSGRPSLQNEDFIDWFRVSWQWTKRLSEGLRFVDWPDLIYKTKTHWLRVSWQRTKRISEGLRFVVSPGLIYKTKTPLISRQLTTNKAFKRRSTFCSFTRLNLQTKTLLTSCQLTTNKAFKRGFSNAACYITSSSTFFDCLFINVPEKMASNTLNY